MYIQRVFIPVPIQTTADDLNQNNWAPESLCLDGGVRFFTVESGQRTPQLQHHMTWPRPPGPPPEKMGQGWVPGGSNTEHMGQEP